MSSLNQSRGPRPATEWRPGRAQAPAPLRRWRVARWRLLQPLFHQQCWCWGADIRGATNLLLEHGFVRERRDGTSRYRLADPAMHLTLLGFGAIVTLPEQRTLVVERATFRWRVGDGAVVDAWRPRDLQAYRPAQREADRRAARMAFALLAGWIAGYERWVTAAMTPHYRAEVLASWEATVVPAHRMAGAWDAAAAWAVTSPARPPAAPPPPWRAARAGGDRRGPDEGDR